MSLADKAAAVDRAEAACVRQRQQRDESQARLKAEFTRAATPARIVVSGLVLGFATGLRTPKGGTVSLAGQLVGGPLMNSLLESVLPGLMAGLTANLAMEDAEDEDQDGPQDAEADDDGTGRADAA